MLNLSNTLDQLSNRLSCNSASSSDLNEFVFAITRPSSSDSALDIGCGTGKQLIPLAKKVSNAVGVDMSAQLLATLQSSLGAQQPNVELIQGNMDELGTLLSGRRFDLIYSCYAAYYSKDMEALVRTVRRDLLKAGGRAFFICP